MTQEVQTKGKEKDGGSRATTGDTSTKPCLKGKASAGRPFYFPGRKDPSGLALASKDRGDDEKRGVLPTL